MRDRALVLICLTLSMAWVTIAAIYLYPDVKEEFEQHRYLRRIGKLHTPVIPIECPRARGIENQDFIREDKNPNRCWVDLVVGDSSSPSRNSFFCSPIQSTRALSCAGYVFITGRGS